MTDPVIHPKFHHFNLKTTRLQEMIDCYSVLVGAEVIFQDAVGAWLSNDQANHRIALLAFPGLHRRPGEGEPHRAAPLRVRVRRASTSSTPATCGSRRRGSSPTSASTTG